LLLRLLLRYHSLQKVACWQRLGECTQRSSQVLEHHDGVRSRTLGCVMIGTFPPAAALSQGEVCRQCWVIAHIAVQHPKVQPEPCHLLQRFLNPCIPQKMSAVPGMCIRAGP